MANPRPIPTPLAYRWRRFLQQRLPALIFILAAALTLWLWNRQANLGNAVGSVEALRVDVPAGVAGLVQLPPVRDTWNRFDTIQANETVAMIANFDDSLSEAKLITLKKQIIKVGEDVGAEKAKFELDLRLSAANSEVDRDRQADQLDWQIEQLRVQLLEMEIELAASNKEYERLSATVAFLSGSLEEGGAVSQQEVVEKQIDRDRVKSIIERTILAIEEIQLQIDYENARRKKRKDSASGRDSEFDQAVQAVLAPIRKQIDVLEAQMGEVQTEFNLLEVKAPISGEITIVHAYPGQAVQAGDPVVTIAQDSGRYIVSYIRADQRIRVEPNMEVRVREKRSGARPVRARIADVGPQVEPVPLQHLRDPTKAEWGLPVTIELPPELNVRPGELIDIIFSSSMARRE